MLAKRLVPCLDVDRGRVVKGVQFVSLRDAGDPVECAVALRRGGRGRAGVPRHHRLAPTRGPSSSTWCGGWRTPSSCPSRWAAACARGGRRRSSCARARTRSAVNTAAVRDPALLDAPRAALRVAGGGAGHRRARASGTGLGGLRARRPHPHRPRRRGLGARRGGARGAGEILLTSMDRDGTKDGFDLPLTRAVADAVNVPVVASGGCGTVAHMAEVLTDGRGQRRPRRLRSSISARCAFPRRRRELRAAREWRCGRDVPCPEAVFDERGLVPVVVQDRASGDVLMVAWANAEALRAHRGDGRRPLLEPQPERALAQGRDLGHTPAGARGARRLRPRHPAHGRRARRARPATPGPAPASAKLHGHARPASWSSCAELIARARPRAARGLVHGAAARQGAWTRTLKKIGEEATEVVLAAKGESDERLAEEAADLLFHLAGRPAPARGAARARPRGRWSAEAQAVKALVLRRSTSGCSAGGRAGARLPRDPGRPPHAGLRVPRPRRARRSARSCWRASWAASASRATRSSAAIPWPRSRRSGAASWCATRTGSARRRESLFAALRERLGPPRGRRCPGLPRFTGGAVGYLSLRRGAALRAHPRPPRRPRALPLASFSFYRSLVAFDHVAQRLVLIADAEPGQPRARTSTRRRVLDALEADLRRAPRPRPRAARRRDCRRPAELGGRSRLPRRGAPRQGVHRRRRHLPGRAVAAGRRAAARSTPSPSTAPCAW